jgi:hypothetical protein
MKLEKKFNKVFHNLTLKDQDFEEKILECSLWGNQVMPKFSLKWYRKHTLDMWNNLGTPVF